MRRRSSYIALATTVLTGVAIHAGETGAGYSNGDILEIDDAGGPSVGKGSVQVLTTTGGAVLTIGVYDPGSFVTPQANPINMGSGLFLDLTYGDGTVRSFKHRGVAPRRPYWRTKIRKGFNPALVAPLQTHVLGDVQIGFGIAGPIQVTPTYTDGTGTHPVTIVEKAMERRVQQTKDMIEARQVFIILGSKDPFALVYFGPPVGEPLEFGPGLTVSDRQIKPYGGGEGAVAACLLEVKYTKRQEQGDTGVPELAYEFGSESEHIETALADQAATGYDAENVGRLINAHQEEVQGTDIDSPILDITEEHLFKVTEFGSGYRRALAGMVQKVNNSPFRDYAAGEVRLIGIRANKANLQQYKVVFCFRVRRNVVGQAVQFWDSNGDQQAGTVTKDGWDYVWAASTAIKGPNPSDPVRMRPRAYFVARVYERADFAALGIGTAPLS